LLKIAITGGAGSGKTTVLRMFQDLGAPVLDADQSARDAVEVGKPAWEELRAAFGLEYFREDGSLDRAKMAHLVFADPQARARLNGIVHPRVAQEIRERVQDLASQGTDLVMVEVPLLFEAGLEKNYDAIIVVSTETAAQADRLRTRDHREAQEISGIIQAQLPLKEKLARADYVVDNGGSLKDTRRRVKNIWEKLQKIVLTEKSKKVSVP